MALKSAARDIGIGFGGAVLGAVVAILIVGPKIKLVPPPPLQSVSFSAPQGNRVPSKVTIYTWGRDRTVPPANERNNPANASWKDSDYEELAVLPDVGTTKMWGHLTTNVKRNVQAVALVVEYPQSGTLPTTVVNFTPAAPVNTDGIWKVVGSVRDAGGAVTTKWWKGDKTMETGEQQPDDDDNP